MFNPSVLLASIIATVACTPTVHDPGAGVVKYLEARDSINDCGGSTFINQGSNASPTNSDCLKIASNIAGGGTWTVSGIGGQHQLVQYGTCAFGVQVDNVIVKIGNKDIIDVINTSVSRFGSSGKVGSKGTMPCQVPGGGTSSVAWGIYHT